MIINARKLIESIGTFSGQGIFEHEVLIKDEEMMGNKYSFGLPQLDKVLDDIKFEISKTRNYDSRSPVFPFIEYDPSARIVLFKDAKFYAIGCDFTHSKGLSDGLVFIEKTDVPELSGKINVYLESYKTKRSVGAKTKW